MRRKCEATCIFAPHFPPGQTNKFIAIHRVFGSSYVEKLLVGVPPDHRKDTVYSLYYEATARMEDPVHGCMSYIYYLQAKIQELQCSSPIAGTTFQEQELQFGCGFTNELAPLVLERKYG